MIQSQSPTLPLLFQINPSTSCCQFSSLGSRYESLECKRFIGGTSCEIWEGKKQDWAGNATDHNADSTLVNREKLNRRIEKGWVSDYKADLTKSNLKMLECSRIQSFVQVFSPASLTPLIISSIPMALNTTSTDDSKNKKNQAQTFPWAPIQLMSPLENLVYFKFNRSKMEHLILTLIQSILPRVFLTSVNSSHCSPSFHAIFVSSSLFPMSIIS